VSLLVNGPLGASAQTRPDYISVGDVLRITDIQLAGSNVLVRFTSQAGKFYRVEYADGLPSSLWQTAADFVPGTGNIVQAIHLGGAGRPLRFYRVKLLTNAELVPLANFSGTPTSGSAPLTVTFSDLSSGWITNRLWIFGDGTTTNTTATSVTHTYLTPGNYTVSLLAAGPMGANSQTRSNYLLVTAVTNALRITQIQLSGSNVLVNFTSQAGSFYRLEYSDGLGTGWLTAADSVPGTGNIVQAIHVGGAGRNLRMYRVKLLTNADLVPSAGFQGTPLSGQAPLQVIFSDTSTGLITNRFWNFGDGSVTNTTSTTVSHTYSTPGTKTVSLLVSGPLGSNTMTRSNYINVAGQLLITSIQVSGANVLVSFTSQAGKTYRLETTSQLSASPLWSTATDQVPGTGTIVVVPHANGAGQASRFYRIRELSQPP
jgi:PKD repeat protein